MLCGGQWKRTGTVLGVTVYVACVVFILLTTQNVQTWLFSYKKHYYSNSKFPINQKDLHMHVVFNAKNAFYSKQPNSTLPPSVIEVVLIGAFVPVKCSQSSRLVIGQPFGGHTDMGEQQKRPHAAGVFKS